MANAVEFIHQFVPPVSGASNSRTLLLLHGTGGNENDLLPLGRALDPGAALLSPRGQVLENGRPRFFRRLAEGVFDEKDVVRRADELADFIEAAGSRYNFRPADVVAVGYSNGANIAGAMMLLGRAKFRCAILFRAMVPFVPKDLPSLGGHRTLVSEGEYDPIVPRTNAEQLASLLRKSGAEITLRFERAGHELTSSDLNAAKQWLVDR